MSPPADLGAFDRIILDGAMNEVPEALIALLARDGVILHARQQADGRAVLIRRANEKASRLSETALFPVVANDLAVEKSTTF